MPNVQLHSCQRREIISMAVVGLVLACSKKESVPAASGHASNATVPEAELKGMVRTNLDSPQPTGAQLARKQKSIAAVKALGLPWLESLPVVEDDASVKPRTTVEVVSRSVATMICAIKGEANDQELTNRLVKLFAASSFFSPQELRFVQNPTPSKQELTDFAWRYECLHVFLWALGYLPELAPPNRIADVAKEVGIVRERGPERFGPEAKLRPAAELLDASDLYYRLHWATTDLRLKGQKHPAADGEIVMERHRAVNWLTRYMNQAWDDVTTDT